MNGRPPEMTASRWSRLPFCEQMAHVGAEIERALHWRGKQHPEYSRQAFERALELLDLSLGCVTSGPRLRELTRVREVIVDFFVGDNQFGAGELFWRGYFIPFATAARRSRP